MNAERVLLFSWPRAILLQLAHPLVAAGVADHSSFRQSAATTARRSLETIRAMLSLTFGGPAVHAATIETIRAIHRRVHGTLAEGVGPFPAGTRYSAEDPALVLWVHVTLVESVLKAYQLLVSPLSGDALDAYLGEAAGVAVELGARTSEVPRAWTDLERCLDTTYRSGVIVVGPTARDVAAAVLRPPLAALGWPVVRANRRITLGLLPGDIREQYGYDWTPADALAFDRTLRRLAAWRRGLPDRITLWPEARRR